MRNSSTAGRKLSSISWYYKKKQREAVRGFVKGCNNKANKYTPS